MGFGCFGEGKGDGAYKCQAVIGDDEFDDSFFDIVLVDAVFT